MIARGNIPGYLSVADAAQQLGVGSHRVYELIKSGMVDAQKVSERTTLVEATSILRYQAFGRKAWRPFCPSVAMGALWILSGAEAYCFTYHQRRRALQAFGGRFGCKVPQACAGGALAHRRFFCRRGDVHGAPIIDSAKVSMELKVEDIYEMDVFENFMCSALNTYAEESVLNEKDTVDYTVFNPVLFEMPGYAYLATGDKIADCLKL